MVYPDRQTSFVGRDDIMRLFADRLAKAAQGGGSTLIAQRGHPGGAGPLFREDGSPLCRRGSHLRSRRHHGQVQPGLMKPVSYLVPPPPVIWSSKARRGS
jgi:hypothetical protein